MNKNSYKTKKIWNKRNKNNNMNLNLNQNQNKNKDNKNKKIYNKNYLFSKKTKLN